MAAETRTSQMELPWIPWQRYVLLLTICSNRSKKTILAGRFRLRVSADRLARGLNRYRGYEAVVFDTRAGINPAPTRRAGIG